MRQRKSRVERKKTVPNLTLPCGDRESFSTLGEGANGFRLRSSIAPILVLETIAIVGAGVESSDPYVISVVHDLLTDEGAT